MGLRRRHPGFPGDIFFITLRDRGLGHLLKYPPIWRQSWSFDMAVCVTPNRHFCRR